MSWTCLENKAVRAKVAHRCSLCGLSIPKGVEYIRRVGVDSGEWIKMNMHKQCEEATEDWSIEEWETNCDEWAFKNEVLKPEVLAEINSMENKEIS